jgi:hypothetical protein
MSKIIRVVTRASNGSLRTKDFENFDDISQLHDKIGIDDCSTDLSLRGLPVFRGLVGPMPESKDVARYESPEVFESQTKEWAQAKTKRRRRRSSAAVAATQEGKSAVPIPNIAINPTIVAPVVISS